ncbi:hypothetical protein C1645_734970 [Glomus cerebriforme]|uniref:Uncharacterized protein n=1 Tax=Glomus cerebriforme TaxID=658196 RepID=A0A397T7N4_9GLOM|nr:hypothetical protein C1645_734970 [Glomus cerebriforme]
MTVPVISTAFTIMEHVAMMDGGYAIIYANYTDPSTTLPQDPFSVKGGLYGLFMEYNKETIIGPVVLYQTPVSGLHFTGLNCEFTYADIGQICILTVNNTIDNTNSFIRVDFLSSGTVYSVNIISNLENNQFNIQSLRYGGYFLSDMLPTNDNKFYVYGYIYDEMGYYYPWELTNPVMGNSKSDFMILPNNSFVLPLPEVGQTWSLVATDLPKVKEKLDHGYNNLHINITSPMINDIISGSDTKFLKIKYYNKIDFTNNGNITIIQDDGSEHGIIRQIVSVNANTNNENTQFLSLIDEDDGTTINVAVIDSAFSVPGGRYYVLIDDGFVKDRTYQEPIFGIRKNVWYFTTETEEDKTKNLIPTISVDGTVLLTQNGTNDFLGLSKLDRKKFYTTLLNELADAIPVNRDRITSNFRVMYDTSKNPKQIILSVKVSYDMDSALKLLSSGSLNQISVDSIANDLNSMIKNKTVTVFAYGETSKYLDGGYGFNKNPNWLEKNRIKLIMSSVVLLVLLVVSALQKKGKRKIVLDFGFAIKVFVTSILFAASDAQTVDNIFLLSVLFTTLPFFMNLGIAFAIVIRELTSEDDKKEMEVEVNGSRFLWCCFADHSDNEGENDLGSDHVSTKVGNNEQAGHPDYEEEKDSDRASTKVGNNEQADHREDPDQISTEVGNNGQTDDQYDEGGEKDSQHVSIAVQMSNDNGRNKSLLSKWINEKNPKTPFINHTALLITCVLLAGIDLKNLNFLDRLCDLGDNDESQKKNKLFKKYSMYFIYGAIINVFSEDIPKIVIQESDLNIDDNQDGKKVF